jgi:RNA polymerase sigma-54 factor
MRFDVSQSMRMGQHMKLAPQMIQSMEILQMSMAELEQRIESELESNATLELSEPSAEGDNDQARLAREQAQDVPVGTREDRPLEMGDASGASDFERLDAFEAEHPDAAANDFGEPPDVRDAPQRERLSDFGTGDPEAGDAKIQAMANTAARGAGLTEQLIDQWRMCDVRADLRGPGEAIIAFIEADGLLRTPLATILKGLNRAGGRPVTPERLEEALRAVQLFLEPPGLGARDTRECLLLQIDARADQTALAGSPSAGERGGGVEHGEGESTELWHMARALVAEHLDDLKNNRLPKIAARLGTSVETLKRAVVLLRGLSLAPGRQLASEASAGIVPDGIVEYDPEHDRYVAYLNDRRLPNLRVNQEYARLAKDRTAPKPTREFLKVNIGNAQFLIDAIEQRKRTLLRVLEAVVAAQREFFDYGPQAIKPLPMTKVAEQLGIHVATVSRAVSDKWVQTPRGVVSLRKFFTGGTTTEAGEEVSWEAIKAALLEMIESEDKKHPLSDDQLAEALKAKGFDIARRTVAKYRGQLEIPTGRLRKAH